MLKYISDTMEIFFGISKETHSIKPSGFYAVVNTMSVDVGILPFMHDLCDSPVMTLSDLGHMYMLSFSFLSFSVLQLFSLRDHTCAFCDTIN